MSVLNLSYLNQTVTSTGTQRLNIAYVACVPSSSTTGNYYPLYENPSGYLNTLSGVSIEYITGISGALANLITVSNAGVSTINSLSGIIDLVGTGNVTVINDGQRIIVSGAGGSVEVNLSGYITTGQADLRYYPLDSNPSGYLTGFDSGLYLEKTETGQFYPASNPSGYITGISTGDFVTRGETSQFASDTNLFLTGENLYNIITGLSGDNSKYYLNSNPSGFITGINTGDFASATALYQTGADLFALISASSAGVGSLNALSGAITLAGAGNVSISTNGQTIIISGNTGAYAEFATIVNLFETGSNLYNLITGLSGVVNSANYYPSSNPSGFITGVNTGDFVTRSETGQFYPASNPSGYITGIDTFSFITTGQTGQFASAESLTQSGITLLTTIVNTGNQAVNHANGIGTNLSGDLHNSGILLYGLITGNSGQSQNDFATKVQLTQSGIDLSADIFESGFTGWTHSQNNALNLSGNLTTTGQTLYQQNTGLSGYLISLISAASAGVSSINGQSGVLNLYGTGGISIFTQGQDIFISGEADPSFFATVPFVTGISGALQSYINSLSGLVDQSIVNSANNALNLSGNLYLTGLNLYTLITGLSGSVNDTFATKIQLTQTGVDLSARDISISGGLEQRITATGNRAVIHSNGIGSGLSGNLTATGATLNTRITSLSGFTNSISGSLYTRITGSGASVIRHANGIGSGLSGALAQTGSNLFNIITGLSGQSIINYATKTELINTGAKITSLSGFVDLVSGGLEIRIIQTGDSAVIHSNGIGSGLSGLLTQTGATLNNKIDSLSGYGDSIFVHRTGMEIISGEKTIVDRLTISGILDQGLNNNIVGTGNHSQGIDQFISGQHSYAQGNNNLVFANYAHAEGGANLVRGNYGHAEGISNIANGEGSHAEGVLNTTLGNYSHVEGTDNISEENYSHVQGIFARTGVTGLFQVGRGNFSLRNDIIYVSTSGENPSRLNGKWIFETGAQVGNSFILTGLIAGTGIYVQDNGNGTFTVNSTVSGGSASNSDGINLSGNLYQTGSNLYNLITGFSGQARLDYVQTGTILAYSSGITTGQDSVYFNFQNHAFASIPVVNATLESYESDYGYFLALSGKSTTGFWVNFSDTILETGFFLNIIAKY